MWINDIQDRVWVESFDYNDVPGVAGRGRYYCQNDGTVDWSQHPDGPWDPAKPRSGGRDGAATVAEKINAFSFLFSGFAKALDQT